MADVRRRLVVVAVAAVALTGVALYSPPERDGRLPWVSLYDQPADRAAAMLDRGDGQFFAMLAQDPTLARPGVARTGEDGFAYRATKPGLGWIAWAGSAGQPQLVPWVLLGVTVASTVLLAWAVGRSQPRAAVAVVALPGVLLSLLGYVGPEVLGAALAVLAVQWALEGRESHAMLALVGAGLLRETLLLVGVGLVLAGVLHWKRMVPPVAVLAAWWLFVTWRVERPMSTQIGFGGFLDGEWGVGTVVSLVVLAVIGVLAWRRRPRLVACLVAPHLVLALFTSPDLWVLGSWPRWTLPLYAVLLAIPDRVSSGGDGAAVAAGHVEATHLAR